MFDFVLWGRNLTKLKISQLAFLKYSQNKFDTENIYNVGRKSTKAKLG